MKYERNKRIGNKQSTEMDVSNQFETDTNRSRHEQNYMARGRQHAQVMYDPRVRNEELEKSNSENRGDGLYYYEPENLNRYEMSPVTEGRQTQNIMQRSPTNRLSVIKAVKSDLNERTDIGRNPINTLSIQIPMKRNEQFESSPKTIYLGQENIFDLNTKTRDRRGSPNQHQGYMIDKPLDNQGPYGSDGENKTKRPQNIQIEMPLNQITKNKMSPNRNLPQSENFMDGREIDEEMKRKEKREKIEKLKNMQNLVYYNNDEDNIEKESEKSNYDHIYRNYGDDIQKLSQNIPNLKDPLIPDRRRRKQTGFNQNKPEGKLINTNIQSFKPFAENFNDRHTVVPNINKLSTIMLSRSLEPNSDRKKLRQEVEGANSFKDKDVERKTFAMTKSPQNKFIRFTMAMLSTKGPNCEDRVITRVMRVDKGGVVDLAQSTHKVKKYEVKNLKKSRSPQSKNQKPRSMKDRLIAAKLVQKWWREVLGRYKTVTDKIIKLQSIWRGYWVRTYLYEIVYFSILSQAFVDKFKPPVVVNARRFVMDKLTNLFADKYKDRLNFEKILNLQKKVKLFLERIRDKRMKFNLRMEKLKHLINREIFDEIRDFADHNDMKLKKTEDFLNKVKRIMRIRIFHQLMFAIFDLPAIALRDQLRRKMMRNSFNKFQKTWLRKNLIRWWKAAAPSKLSDSQKATLVKNLRNKIIKPYFDELLRRIRKMLPKGFRERFIRRLLNRHNKIYNEMCLKEYFTRWKTIARKLEVLEFKTNIFDTFLFRTKKGMLRRRLRTVLRLWHQKATTKLDLGKVNEFVDNLRKALKRHAYNAAKDNIDKCANGIKQRTFKELLQMKGKFRLVTLRIYWNQWRAVVAKDTKLQLQTKLYLGMKNKNFTIGIMKILSGRFQDWRRKANMLAYLEKMGRKDANKRKIEGATRLFNEVLKDAKRIGFNHLYPKLRDYLNNIIKNKALKRMAQMDPKFNKLLLRRYVSLWRDIMSHLRKKDFRNKFFNKLLNNASNSLKKNFLRAFFQRWLRNKNKNPLANISEGLRRLKNELLRKNIKPILEAFNKKIDDVNKRLRRNAHNKAGKKGLEIRKRFMAGVYKNAFYKWKLRALDLSKKDDRNLVWSKLFNATLRKIYLRSLANRFSFWRSNKKEFKWDELEAKRKRIDQAFQKIKDKNQKLNAPQFMKNVKNHKSNKFLKKFMDKLLSFSDMADDLKLKRYLKKWKDICKRIDMYDLKTRFFKIVLGNKDIDAKKLRLLRALRLWKKQIEIDRLFRLQNVLLLVNNGVEHIKKVHQRREAFFINRIKKFLKADPRAKLLLALEKRLARPRYSLSRAFDRWRRVNDVEKMRENEMRLIERLLFGMCRKLKSRMTRDTLKRRFAHWKKATFEKPQDYYDKICRGVKALDHFIKRKGGNEPFTLISNHKNYQKIFDKLLPAESKLKKRLQKDFMLKCLKLWKDHMLNGRKRDWAVKILKNVKDSQLRTFRANIMQKYFRKFAGFRPKSLTYPNLVKAEFRIKRTLMNRFWYFSKTQMKKFGDEKMNRKATNLLFGQSKIFLKRRLHRAFLIWHRNMLRDDSEIKSKVLRNFKRMILEKYFSTPLENFFRRWLRAMIEKPKDIKPYIIGTNLLTNHMRKRLNPILFKKIGDYRSPVQLQKALFDKILPKSKFAKNRHMRNRLFRWRDIVNKLALKEMKAKTLNLLYGRDKNKVLRLFLTRTFKLWKANTLRKPIDYTKINQGEKIYFGMMVKKYLQGFITPDMKNYAYYRFLRGIFNGSSKYQLRALKPFLARWRDITHKLKIMTVKHSLWSRVVRKMTNEETKKALDKIMRRRLQLWRANKDAYKQKLADNIEKGINAVKRDVNKKILPELLRRLKNAALKRRRTNALTKTQRVCNNLWNIILKRKLDLWAKNTRALKMKEFKIKVMQTNLKLMRNKFNKTVLWRAFQKFKPPKEITTIQKNYSPLAVALITTKRLLNRRPWQRFKDLTKMMNLKLPQGVSLSQVLARHGKNYAKLMVFRNFAMRPFWITWKNNVKKIEAQEMKEKVAKKLYWRNSNRNQAIILRHYIRLWQDKKNQIELKEVRDRAVGNLYKTMYANNIRMLARRLFRHWKKVNEDHMDKLNKITLASTKLDHYYKRKHLHELERRLGVKKDILTKKDKAEKIWRIFIKKLDKGKVFLAYYLWKKRLFDYKLMRLKYHVLKNLVNVSERDKEKNNYNKMKEYFLRWRIIANPKNIYEMFENIRKGEHIIMRNLRHHWNRDVFDSIRHRAIQHKIRESLMKWLAKFDDNAKKELMRIKLHLWKVRLNDKKVMKNKLNKMFHKYLESTHGIHELIEKPLNKLKESAQKIHTTKNNAVNIIQRFFRSLFEEENNVKAENKNTCLKSSLHKADKKKSKNAASYLKLWKKNAGLIKTEEAGKLIQNFLRGGVKNRDSVAKKVKDFNDRLTKAVRKAIWNRIKQKADKERLKQILLRLTKDIPDELKKEFYHKYFHRWWKHVIKKKTQDAGFLMTTITRGYLARKFVKKQLKKKYKMNNLIAKLFGKHLNQLKLYFNRWNLTARIIKMSHAASVIQNYLAEKLAKKRRKEAQKKLQELFKRHFKKQVAEMLKKAAGINKDSGKILYYNLRRIFVERPFNAIKKHLQFIAKLKKLRQVYPVLQEKFRLYWVPYYLRMWKRKTWDEKIKKLIQIQNWIKGKLALWRLRIKQRKQNLLTKYLARMTRDNKLLMKIYFKNWWNRARNQGLTKAALNLQKMWQGNTSRKNLDREVAKHKLKQLLRRLFIRMLNHDFVKMADFTEPLNNVLTNVLGGGLENRYATNNLLDLAKNAIRNNFLYNLTKKREYNDYLTSLRRYWELWHKNLNNMDKKALELQKNYRKFLAQKELRKKIKIRDTLYNVMLKNTNNLHQKVRICFDTWRNKANFLNLDQQARVIQNYVKNKNERWRWTKIMLFFKKLAAKKIPHDLLNFAKQYKLREALQKVYLRKLLDHIKLREKIRKLTWFFLKHLKAEDEKFKQIFLQRYHIEWWDRTKKLNALRNRSALMIQNNFRRYLMEKFLRREREKKARVLRILDKLTNDNELRMRIKLRLWHALVNADRLRNSARVITNFMDDFKNKSRRKKNKKRLDEIKKGLEALEDPVRRAGTRTPFNMIKDKAAGNKLTKLWNLLCRKRQDHLQTGVDRIKEFNELMHKIKNAHAQRIQKKWKLFWYKKGIWGVIEKIRKLRFMLNLMKNRDLRILNKNFKLWRHKAVGDIIQQAAKTIHQFCDDRILKYIRRKDQEVQKKYKKMAEELEKNKVRLPAIKLLRYWIRLHPGIDALKKHIFLKFRYNIDNYDKLRCMWKLFRIPKSCSLKMLRRSFLRWRDNADKIKKDAAAKTITKNLRANKQRQKEKRIVETMTKRLLSLAFKHQDLKKFYFMRWAGNTFQNRMKEAADKINKFVKDNWDRIQAKKKWKRLTDGLHDKKYLQDGLGLLRRYKVWKSLNILFKVCDHKLKKDGMDELKKRAKKKEMLRLLTAVAKNYEKKDDILRMDKWWRIWKKRVNKHEERDNALKKLAFDFEVLFKIHAAKFYGDAAIWKRTKQLFDTVDKVKAMKKLKEKALFVQKMRTFKNLIHKGDGDLANDNKATISDSLYRIYTYRMLSKLVGAIQKCNKGTIAPYYGKNFINKLDDLMHSESKFTYHDKIRSEGKIKPKRMTFAAETNSTKRKKIEEGKSGDDNSQVAFLMPFFVRYIQKLIQEKQKWANDKLKEVFKGSKLADKMKNFLNQLKPDKKKFFDNLHSIAKYNEETPILKNKLKEILRRYVLKKIREAMIPAHKFLQLVYLCRITMMHGDISDKRFNREVIKRWKFVVHMQRLAKKKMESMYKQFHLQYLATANEIFGDDESNPGVISEFSSLSENMGLFKNEGSSTVETLKKVFIKSSTRRYDFGKVEFIPEEEIENPMNENDMYASKTNKSQKSQKSASNYEILDGEGDESFIQGREDSTMNKKR